MQHGIHPLRVGAARHALWLVALYACHSLGCAPPESKSAGTSYPRAENPGNADGAQQSAAVAQPPPSSPVDEPRSPADVTFPPHWCDRATPDSYDVLGEVATAYYNVQFNTCATTKLTRDLGEEQSTAWANYLIDYTHALAGCDVPDASFGGRGFLPGGIGQFGLANLAAIGLAQPRLGSDDAELLIGQYLAVFAAPLRLSEIEHTAVRAFLWSNARAQIEEGMTASLSACTSGAPTAN